MTDDMNDKWRFRENWRGKLILQTRDNLTKEWFDCSARSLFKFYQDIITGKWSLK